MGQQINVNIRMDKDIKERADTLFNEFGFNLTTAINAFVRKALMEEAIPFEIKKKRRHIPLKERLKDYNGDYKAEEWDTGEPVGREVL